MNLVEPQLILNSVMGKIYNLLTNGDDTVPKSEDNFLSWATPGIPIEPEDLRFLRQGLTGVVRKAAIDEMSTTSPDGTTKRPELTAAEHLQRSRLALQKVGFEVAVGINRATPITVNSLVTLALLGVRDRALTLDEVRAVIAPVRRYIEARKIPQGELALLDDAEGVALVLSRLDAAGVAAGAEPAGAALVAGPVGAPVTLTEQPVRASVAARARPVVRRIMGVLPGG